MVVHFNPALTLSCAVGLCAIKCAVFPVFLQFPVQKVVQNEEVVVKKKTSSFWTNITHVKISTPHQLLKIITDYIIIEIDNDCE